MSHPAYVNNKLWYAGIIYPLSLHLFSWTRAFSFNRHLTRCKTLETHGRIESQLVWVKLFTICSHFLTSAGLKGTGVGTASKAAKEIWVGYTPWKSGLTGFLWKQQPDFYGTYGEGMNLRTKLRRGNQNVSSHVRKREQVGMGCFRLQCRQEFIGKDFNCWLLRTAVMTHGLFKYRDSPGFTIYHEEVVTDASSVLLSLPRHEKICKRLYLLPTHPQQKDSFYWQNHLTGVG